MVLLKNDGDLLPLDPRIGRLAVIGPSAASIRLLQGDYSYPAHVEIIFGPTKEPGDTHAAGVLHAALAPGQEAGAQDLLDCFPESISVLDGIRARVSASTNVEVARGCGISDTDRSGIESAVAIASESDVALVVVGGRSGLVKGCTSGEANDRADLGLPGVQSELVRAVVASGTPTVLVLINGRPLALTDVYDDVAAILEAWLPGEEGGHAVADVLFGLVNPAGRLPVTLARAVGQMPLYYNHKPSGARSQFHGDYADLSCQPLLPFGHGLSYTRFVYSDLALSSREPGMDETVSISATISNVGDRDGEEVVQLYLNDRVASVTRPVKQLVGFARILVSAGHARKVTFHLDPGQLAFYDRDMRFVVEPGEVAIMLGSSSEDIRLEATLEMKGRTRELRSADVMPTRVEVEPPT
jgi:beta-glucosidase